MPESDYTGGAVSTGLNTMGLSSSPTQIHGPLTSLVGNQWLNIPAFDIYGQATTGGVEGGGIGTMYYGQNGQMITDPLQQIGLPGGSVIYNRNPNGSTGSQYGVESTGGPPMGPAGYLGEAIALGGAALVTGGAALGGLAGGEGAAAGEAGAMSGAGGAVGGVGGGAAAGGAAAGGAEGLDTIGQMITNVPEGMTATSYAQSLGYPSADAWLASGAGTSAVGAAGAGGGGADAPAGGNGQFASSQLFDPSFYGPSSSGFDPAAFTGPADPAGFGPSDVGGMAGQAGDSGMSYWDQLKGYLTGDKSAAFQNSQFGRYAPMLKAGSSALNGITSLYGLYQGNQLAKYGKQLSQDPLAGQRQGAADQLARLNANPGQVLPTLPGYQAGLTAVERSMAAQGYTGSGNMMAALQQYGGNAFQQESARLQGLGTNPYAGAGASLYGGGLNLTLNSLGLGAKTLGALGA